MTPEKLSELESRLIAYPHEITSLYTSELRDLVEAAKELNRLRSENGHAQKYGNVNAAIMEYRQALQLIIKNDKTEYDYETTKLNRDGEMPGPGCRFATPREIAKAALKPQNPVQIKFYHEEITPLEETL